jgi:hypothetical protein
MALVVWSIYTVAMDDKIVNKVGWFASAMAICMFFSFIDQIRLNVSGRPGSILLPLAAMVNCLAWTAYGWLKARKDWPIICGNGLGILVAAVTAVTAILATAKG